jgi:hypothetical protein
MKHKPGYVPPDQEHLMKCDWLNCEAGIGIAGCGCCFLHGEWWKKKCKQFKKEIIDIHDLRHPGIDGDTEITLINNKCYTVKDLEIK